MAGIGKPTLSYLAFSLNYDDDDFALNFDEGSTRLALTPSPRGFWANRAAGKAKLRRYCDTARNCERGR